MRKRLKQVWASLPLDGQGLTSAADPDFGDLRRWAAARFWRRAPWWIRPLAPATRLAWAAAALFHVRQFAALRALSPSSARHLYWCCVRSGARPNEAFIWSRFFAPPALHPLPGRAVGALLSQLGNAAEHRLLSDKYATSDLLSRANVSTPRILDLIPRGCDVDLSGAIWSMPRRIFVKPRHGSAGRGTMAVDVIDNGRYQIDGAAPVGRGGLRARLAAVGTRDDLLVQERLGIAPPLQDLAQASAAPVLRITIAREPGAPPFLHSAHLSIAVPDESMHHFIRGQIRVPIGADNYCMRRGIWFHHPGQRFSHLPWNQGVLAGREVPGMALAVAMTMRATSLLPGLALVNWDIILAPEGPVVLEGNTGGNWILTNLSALEELESVPLAPLLRKWISAEPQARDRRPAARTS